MSKQFGKVVDLVLVLGVAGATFWVLLQGTALDYLVVAWVGLFSFPGWPFLSVILLMVVGSFVWSLALRAASRLISVTE